MAWIEFEVEFGVGTIQSIRKQTENSARNAPFLLLFVYRQLNAVEIFPVPVWRLYVYLYLSTYPGKAKVRAAQEHQAHHNDVERQGSRCKNNNEEIFEINYIAHINISYKSHGTKCTNFNYEPYNWISFNACDAQSLPKLLHPFYYESEAEFEWEYMPVFDRCPLLVQSNEKRKRKF